MTAQCPLCEEKVTKLITQKVRFGRSADVRKCQSCSLIFLDQDSYDFPEAFYEAEYHQTYLTHVDPEILDPEKYYEKMLKTTKMWSDRIKDMLTGEEVMLDVGCSTGHLMMSLKDKTREIYGHEINEKEIQFCREKLDLDVSNQPLDKRFQKQYFDYILAIFVLEHIAEPIKFLSNLKQFLKPTGKFIIVVPNVEDPLLSLYDMSGFHEFYFCIEHLFYYSPKTLAHVIQKSGMSGEIARIQEYPISNHLNWIYQQQPQDILSARSIAPMVRLREPEVKKRWDRLWATMNSTYMDFLSTLDFSDRIWCVVGAKQ